MFVLELNHGIATSNYTLLTLDLVSRDMICAMSAWAERPSRAHKQELRWLRRSLLSLPIMRDKKLRLMKEEQSFKHIKKHPSSSKLSKLLLWNKFTKMLSMSITKTFSMNTIRISFTSIISLLLRKSINPSFMRNTFMRSTSLLSMRNIKRSSLSNINNKLRSHPDALSMKRKIEQLSMRRLNNLSFIATRLPPLKWQLRISELFIQLLTLTCLQLQLILILTLIQFL